LGTPTAIDELIRSAFERGNFDDFPGNGKPLDLRDYFNTPEDLRLAFSILKKCRDLTGGDRRSQTG
jgi:hypothetical protein